MSEKPRKQESASRPARTPSSGSPAPRMLDRVPPCSIETEECLLGCILIKPDVCDDVAAIVQPDDFFDEANALLFRHMKAMQESRKRIDLPLLVERLKKHGDLERMGGLPTLGRLASRVPHAGFAKDYATAVLEYATRRKLIDACTDSLVESYESEDAAGSLLERAESRIFSIAENHLQENILPLSRVIESALDRLDARLKGEHTENSVESGFIDLDNLTAGLHR
ncbi:MAG TPA: DnaB-like helicase N-terminal domain-containing protein, partial [Pirellulaceae bacterium]